MLYYGVDNAYELDLAKLATINPPPNWVLVYTGGPTATHAWAVSAKKSIEPEYKTVPCYVGQNDLERNGQIYHTGTYTVAQAHIDAADAIAGFQAYGYENCAYWLDTEYISYYNSGAPVLTYIDAFHVAMNAAGYHAGQYGSGPMLEAYHPSVPCGAALATWFTTAPITPPNILDIPLSDAAKARYSFLCWQYWNHGDYDQSVSDDRMFNLGDSTVPTSDLPGTLYDLGDGTQGRYFAETGYSIAHGFRSYWEKFGAPSAGVLLFGYPISREYTRMMPDGQAFTCQMFERARFEWHPNSNAEVFDVELGLIGNLVVERTNESQTYPQAFVKENPPKVG